MARLEVSGIEKELADFLDGVDLAMRASDDTSKRFKAAADGGKCSNQDLYSQHGGEVLENSIVVPVDQGVGKRLLRTSQDVALGLKSEIKQVNTSKSTVRIYCTVPVCFTFDLPTANITAIAPPR